MSASAPVNPFTQPGTWLKAALHVHTTKSDGHVTPEAAVARYREHGYHVVAFTDHEQVVLPAPLPTDILCLPGAEWCAHLPGTPATFHFVALGMAPGHEETCRRLLAAPYELAAHLEGCCDLVILAHPYWSALTTEAIMALRGSGTLEVYNHGSELEDQYGYAQYVWDQLLARGQRWWGVAVDDAHWRVPASHAGGWTCVKVRERTQAAVIAALRTGAGYASTGAELHEVRFRGPRHVYVRCAPARTILFRCNGWLGNGLHTAPAGGALTEAEHRLPDRATFVRVEVTDAAGRKAWSNPFYLPAAEG